MRYKTHIVSSLTAGAGLAIMLNYPFHIGYVIGLCFGSLLPDIDEPRSFIGRRSFGLSKYVKQKYGIFPSHTKQVVLLRIYYSTFLLFYFSISFLYTESSITF
ncbi:metal-dependent hydrolase [Bacillus mesophilum]|uniref:Metal-dependent hydrolase n=1 Tax=Bacillus mesophilum TaxID=1071718 RepID=A0A7V7UVL1_9BACI|nr:metal-dependent hydrolase [Bacillus mesophilum]